MTTPRFFRVLAAALAALVLLAPAAIAADPQPPVAKVEPTVDTVFGVELIDNYAWLRDRTDPDVLNYLRAENEYAEAMLAHAEDLQETLYNEMVSRIRETDLSVPVRHGDYYYYTRDEEGKEYKIYCRRKGEDGKEEILLDLNVLAEGKDYLLLGGYEVSPNHRLLAFAYDTAGNEEYTVRIKDLSNGALYEDVIEATSGDLAWGNDNRTLFYTTQDDTYRPFKLWRHTMGATAPDSMIFHEPDDAFWLWLSRARSGQYIFLNMHSNTTSESWYLDADTPDSSFAIIQPREHEVEYTVDHHDNHFYIVTNADDARNSKLMRAPVTDPGRENWEEMIPHRTDVKLSGVDLFTDYMAVYERRDGLQTVRIRSFADGTSFPVEFDEPVYSVDPGSNREFDASTLRLVYTSLVTPKSIYDYHVDTKQLELRKQTEVLGDFDPSEFTQERLFATAEDGAAIPMSVVYKTDLFTKDGGNPLYLYGYGAYGINMDPWFSSSRLSLLNRGFVFVIPHIRGGGELGRYWYDEGKLLNKRNTFTDFIACAEHLVDQQYTSHDKLVISGGSAGGLTVGAVVNMRPDICRIAIADVPFVDIINTMRDETIPLTVIEWEEWGNPNTEEYFEYMYSYSPYDQVKAQDYPHMLITAGLNDPRVAYWEPAKWTARLRATKTDNNTLLFKTVMEGGHFGTSGRYAKLKELAFEYAFILDVLGMNE
ncbi:prolyl oligopeptidase family serine peptidase [candidate division GN15 bacterium]|nr:prolyl oligopeptidase family serine peptidase [candidate division GN15 bacterium]